MEQIISGREREIEQLWFVAKRYQEIAAQTIPSCRNHFSDGMSQFAGFFDRGRQPNEAEAQVTLPIAHLSSAAVRLSSVEECFKRPQRNIGIRKSD